MVHIIVVRYFQMSKLVLQYNQLNGGKHKYHEHFYCKGMQTRQRGNVKRRNVNDVVLNNNASSNISISFLFI